MSEMQPQPRFSLNIGNEEVWFTPEDSEIWHHRPGLKLELGEIAVEAWRLDNLTRVVKDEDGGVDDVRCEIFFREIFPSHVWDDMFEYMLNNGYHCDINRDKPLASDIESFGRFFEKKVADAIADLGDKIPDSWETP